MGSAEERTASGKRDNTIPEQRKRPPVLPFSRRQLLFTLFFIPGDQSVYLYEILLRDAAARFPRILSLKERRVSHAAAFVANVDDYGGADPPFHAEDMAGNCPLDSGSCGLHIIPSCLGGSDKLNRT